MTTTSRPEKKCEDCGAWTDEKGATECVPCGSSRVADLSEFDRVVVNFDGYELTPFETDDDSRVRRIESAAGAYFEWHVCDLGNEVLDDVSFYDATSDTWHVVQLEYEPIFSALEYRTRVLVHVYDREHPMSISERDSKTVGDLADRAATLAGFDSRGESAFYLQRIDDEIPIDRRLTMRESGLREGEVLELMQDSGGV